MSSGFADSNRRQELPPDWESRRKAVLSAAKHRCAQCGRYANQVDHINRGNDHSFGNLQALCAKCHGRKTAAEGNEARKRFSERRPGPKHPGLL